MINLKQTLTDSQAVLETAGISHGLIGCLALAIYGQHRATLDVDFLADGTKKDLIKSSFLSNGWQLKSESPEVLRFSGVGAVNVLLANRPLSQQMLRYVTKNPELGVMVARPEDIIGLKIQAYTNDDSRVIQEKADIQKLLQRPNLDATLLKQYAELFNQWPEIERMMGTSINKTMEEYFRFVDKYWQMFKPPTENKKLKNYSSFLL